MTRPARDMHPPAAIDIDRHRIWGRTLSTHGVIAFEKPAVPRGGSRPKDPAATLRAGWRLCPVLEAS
jgi:hypothetical protein